jgi:hypothetical protein
MDSLINLVELIQLNTGRLRLEQPECGSNPFKGKSNIY